MVKSKETPFTFVEETRYGEARGKVDPLRRVRGAGVRGRGRKCGLPLRSSEQPLQPQRLSLLVCVESGPRGRGLIQNRTLSRGFLQRKGPQTEGGAETWAQRSSVPGPGRSRGRLQRMFGERFLPRQVVMSGLGTAAVPGRRRPLPESAGRTSPFPSPAPSRRQGTSSLLPFLPSTPGASAAGALPSVPLTVVKSSLFGGQSPLPSPSTSMRAG